jgi:hypothetical protein
MTTDITTRNTPDRMHLPIVGLTTFVRQRACPDWDRLDGAEALRKFAAGEPSKVRTSRRTAAVAWHRSWHEPPHAASAEPQMNRPIKDFQECSTMSGVFNPPLRL